MMRLTPKSLEEQAIILGYKRVNFKENWGIEPSTIPVKELFHAATYMARVEGQLFHAHAIEVRLDQLNVGYRFIVGCLKNGCKTAYVTNEGLKCKRRR